MEPSLATVDADGWLTAILNGDVDAAWSATAPELRKALVQHLVWDNDDRPSALAGQLDSLVEALSEAAPAHADWPAMKLGLQRILAARLDGFDIEAWRPLQSRPAGLDLELVLYIDVAGGPWEPETHRPVMPLLMRWTGDTWQVSGFGDEPAVPGWPPVFTTTATWT